MKIGLVLGAGGVVGMSYHAGVLQALSEHGGFDPSSADLIVGTSAGSVVGTLLRSGWSAEELWRFAHEENPARPFEARRESPGRRARRAVGSAYVAGRSMVRAPMPRLPRSVTLDLEVLRNARGPVFLVDLPQMVEAARETARKAHA